MPAQANGSCGPTGCGSCSTPCFKAPLVCPDHGTNCEPDDHVEPPTVSGEAI